MYVPEVSAPSKRMKEKGKRIGLGSQYNKRTKNTTSSMIVIEMLERRKRHTIEHGTLDSLIKKMIPKTQPPKVNSNNKEHASVLAHERTCEHSDPVPEGSQGSLHPPSQHSQARGEHGAKGKV